MYRQSGQVHYLEQFKASILGQINSLGREEGGIFTHGRVNQEELAKAMYESNFWTYPTQFMETSCITALEAQAAGVIPVTSELAALKETVAIEGLRVEGWPMNLSYQNQWFNLLSYLIEDASDEEIINIRSKSRSFATKFTWEKSYNKWCNLFLEIRP
jgi:glycosyltransferase involved in cell wall biosynthesis